MWLLPLGVAPFGLVLAVVGLTAAGRWRWVAWSGLLLHLALLVSFLVGLGNVLDVLGWEASSAAEDDG